MIRFVRFLLLLPFQILLLGTFLVADLIRVCTSLFRPDPAEPSPLSEAPLASIIVLNWNGRHLLEESLPPLIRAVARTGRPHQILLVDNGSEDDSVDWVVNHFPEVDVLTLPENLGFIEGNNRGVEAAAHEIVVLLNNDMIVDEDFLPPLLEGFKIPRTFAVTSQIEFPKEKRREETGNTQGYFQRGYLHLSHDPIRPYHYKRKYLPVLWAGGGSSAFRRDLFLEFGSFSEVFSPCYTEDADLSYRAWRRGWKVLLAAESKVLHKHRSSSSVRFLPQELEDLIQERRLWYLWKNFQLRTLVWHFLLLPFHLSGLVSWRAYFRSFRKAPSVIRARIGEPSRTYRDDQFLEWIAKPLAYLNDFYPERRRRSEGGPLRILMLSGYLPHLGTHGGAGRVFQLLKRAARVHDFTLLTFYEDDRDLSFAGQAEAVCERVELVLRRDFEPLSYFPYEPFEEFHCSNFEESLVDLLAEEDFDLVHYEWTQMALYSDLLPDIPSLITEIEVNYAAHRTLVSVESNPLKKIRLFYNTLQTLYREIELCRKVDQIVCVTDEDRDYLASYLPEEKLRIVNTGVETGYFDFRPTILERDSIIFVGAFRHSPNLDAMQFFCSRIFPRILQERPQTHLYIVGSSPTKEIEQLGESESITVTGFVEDIRHYYELAHVVVVPLRTGVGIRGKILEGWSVGRAMVATPLACQGLVASHGENILIAEKADKFALWTLALLRNPDFCEELGRRGRETVERYYEWDLLGEQMVQVYDGLAEKPRIPENEG